MVKKEIAEIRKQFTHANTAISKITGCYVGGEKEIIATLCDSFLCLPEEETFKYFEIFAKCLSGSVGRNLINMQFPLESEFEGGTQHFINRLRDSELKDESLLEEFYKKVIDNYEYTGNYLILLIHSNYDIPGISADGIELEDASEEVYSHILCAICPVELEKAALSYDNEKGVFTAKDRDWIALAPVNGFLFPAFNDRHPDIHEILYYTKQAEKINTPFIDSVLGVVPVLTAGSQKESFKSIVTESLGETCDFDVVRTINEKVSELVEESKDEPEPVMLDKVSVVKVLESCGVPEEKCRIFEEKFDEEIGPKASLMATNIIDTKAVKVKTPSMTIKVNAENTDLLETRMVDGRRCIVIPLDNDVEINGIPVKCAGILENEEE